MAEREIRLGKYRVLSRLGKGGMGEVYTALDESLDRKVALKVMSRTLTADPEFVARFRREARSAAAVSHPNVTQIHELSEDRGIYFFAMELVEGETLEGRLARTGSLPPGEALDVVAQAARGLAAAAARGLIHRDIKPSNILIARDGTVKLTDFGLARAVEDASHLTKTDVILGTPHYVSPEQARGDRDIDARSDMYSLGVTLYQCLSGRLPFDATTAMGVMLRHVNDAPPPLAECCPALPAPLAGLVHRLLVKDPAGRFDTYDELLRVVDELRGLVATLPSRPASSAVGAASAPSGLVGSAPTPVLGATVRTPASGARPLGVDGGTVVAPAQGTPSPGPGGPAAALGATRATPSKGSAVQPSAGNPAALPSVDPGSSGSGVALPSSGALAGLDPLRFPPFQGLSDAVWAVVRRPADTFTRVGESAETLRPPLKLAGWIFVSSVLLANMVNPTGLDSSLLGRAIWRLLAPDLFLTVPVVTMTLARDRFRNRLAAALSYVVLTWPGQAFLAVWPFGILVLPLYPLLVYKGQKYLLGYRGFALVCGFCLTLFWAFLRLVGAVAVFHG